MSASIFIKHMVCPRCIATVERVLDEAQITPQTVMLGEVILESPLPEEKRQLLGHSLKAHGFELLESGKSTLVAQIKAVIVEQVHYTRETLHVNFSTLLSEKLHHEYSYLSRLFSAEEGITIEKFTTTQKIERVKELLSYNEKTLSEIAFDLGYSSVAHLSAQFKKETGMTPTAYKNQDHPLRSGLDL